MVLTLRLGASGAGDLFIANYDTATGTWSDFHEFLRGDDGVAYNDAIAATSITRNPYLNDITYSGDGDLHASFTWRETANGTANHDLSYIRSSDGGLTWLNDSNDNVGGLVSILSPGIIINSTSDFISPFVVTPSSGDAENLIDDFSGDLSNWTSTVILDAQNAGSNSAAFEINDNGQLELATTNYNGIEQYAFIYNGLSLGVGEEVLLDVPIPLSGNRNLGLYVGGTEPTTGVLGTEARQDYINIYSGTNNNIATRGFDGTSELNIVEANANGAATMFIAQPVANQFDVGYFTTSGIRIVVETRTPNFPNTANFVGIYADSRAQGTLGTADNFRIRSLPSTIPSDNPLGLIDREQTLMNQQGQTVDSNGRVHVLMWSRADPSTRDSSDRAFDTTEAAHSHYFKDPITGVWTKNQLPVFDQQGNDAQVGTRGNIAYDSDGNVYAAYTSPGIAGDHNRNFYDPGTLIIAGATADNDYQDWSILYRDNSVFDRFFEGEPVIDQQRLVNDGVLSVFIQEGSSNFSVTTSDLHVLDFDIAMATDFLLGDVNRDGSVSFADISSFIAVLSSGAYQIEADIDQNDTVDFTDISPFISLLSSQ